MADKSQSTSGSETRKFDKSLNENVNDFHLSDSSWTHARNAINNSRTGDLGKLGNEPGTLFCQSIPYVAIGAIHATGDKWFIFSTNNTDSEIGLFEEDTCTYTKLINDRCLKFNTHNLIKGTSRSTSNCTYKVYWDDGLNPSRLSEFVISGDIAAANVYSNPNSPIEWQQSCVLTGDCNICTNLPALDCDKIRLAPFITIPCVKIRQGVSSGTLPNGSYIVFVAYAINGQKVSDYYPSNVQSLFNHNNTASSLDVEILSADGDFDELIVIVCSTTNGQTVAQQAGIYSTRQKLLSFDVLDNRWIDVPIEQLPIMNPVTEKSDAMFSVNNYLIRTGPYSKENFNYQPLANQIVAKWSSVEYPADYYRKGGNQTGYMRDEVYPFFIRWIYDTGDKSASYHIPGRPEFPGERNPSVEFLPTDPFNEKWFSENTAVTTSFTTSTLPDGGIQIAEGYMGYWESSEQYPDNKPQIWDANIGVSPYGAAGALASAHNLCGRKIRHHKFPDNYTNGNDTTNHFNQLGTSIRIMGAKFSNIKAPVMNDGLTLIPGIVGYEILRGTRNGNKSVVAKGIINNTVKYGNHGTDIEGKTSNRQPLYPNYPYNDLRPDPFISVKKATYFPPTLLGFAGTGEDMVPQNPLDYLAPVCTFHSPDTNFTDPYLSAKEIKVYEELHGDVVGKFEYSEKHPKHKLVTNATFLLSTIAGIGIASISINGKRTIDHKVHNSADAIIAGAPGANLGALVAITAIQQAYEATNVSGAPLVTALGGGSSDTQYTSAFDLNPAYIAAVAAGLGALDTTRGYLQEDGAYKNIPGPLRLFAAVPTFMYYFTEGTDNVMNIIRNILKYQEFALRYHSHCLYAESIPFNQKHRYEIGAQQYVGPQITDLGSNYRINNLYRIRTVAIELTGGVIPIPVINDTTRIRASEVDVLWTNGGPLGDKLKNPTQASFSKNSVYRPDPAFPSGNGGYQLSTCLYVGLKQRIQNQYGQLINIIEVPTGGCSITNREDSGVIFGGDIYIGRYTEKNTFFYFYDWLYGQPDGAQFDYTQHNMLPFPRYWGNFNDFETSDFTSSVIPGLTTIFSGGLSSIVTPSDFYNLDGLPGVAPGFNGLSDIINIRLGVKWAYFYLFNSGVRDFFVESEINVDLRDWGDDITQQHYDPYRFTDTKALFDTAIIKTGNYYKYDQSLSISKLFMNYVSWAAMQQFSYDPYIAETCYTYSPNRVIYSLPSQDQAIKDSWQVFLPANFYNFSNKVTSIKSINKSGAIILFDNSSPVMFQGTDELQTGLNTKLIIGDGGLFSQPLQSLVNADKPFEYGSCQDRLSVLNTAAGLFWISQNQGKIYQMTGGIEDITTEEMKWWFALYLPYMLTVQFPDFELIDNPIAGIGCQTIYDNLNGLVYFTKKDYVIKPGLPDTITYKGGDLFSVNGILDIGLGDPNYFDDVSWTASYDPKTKNWIGWHDWHPDLLLPGKNTFMSIVPGGSYLDTFGVIQQAGPSIWIHNLRTDLYCNYYGTDYPFEVEFMVDSVQEVNTLRSIEYQLECYKYATNNYDRFHKLDFNFDEAVVYNTEQVSGLLRLNLNPKLDPFNMLQYPIINTSSIDIIYSKEEQKYRFNQFADITDDRGEFNPMAQRMIWNTADNGYVRVLNPFNMDYTKPEFQRKKFRHYETNVFLRRKVCGDAKMLIMITNTKNLNSPR